VSTKEKIWIGFRILQVAREKMNEENFLLFSSLKFLLLVRGDPGGSSHISRAKCD
jgi:hypothetical protein